jgi:hypothetical protein
MMDENPLARTKIAYGRARLLDHADWFVTQHQRGFAPDVPGHNVTRTDAAGADADEDFIGANFRRGAFFDADIAEIIKTRDLHTHVKTLGPAAQLVNRGKGKSCARQFRMVGSTTCLAQYVPRLQPT